MAFNRGFKAGIIFHGSNFVPGVTTTYRRRGDGLPSGNSDYFWRLPNIYFGDYLEISTSDDAPEAALSWRDYEFQAKNPDGSKSEWVIFSYPFDDESLTRIRLASLAEGEQLLAADRPAQAVEPLRKAWVFADRMLGIHHAEALAAKAVWETAREKAALSKLHFRQGDSLKVTAGPHAGRRGKVDRLMLNHLHAYVVEPTSDEGEPFMAADNEVERLAEHE